MESVPLYDEDELKILKNVEKVDKMTDKDD